MKGLVGIGAVVWFGQQCLTEESDLSRISPWITQ